MAEQNDSLKCILLTLQSENVIVPNAAVAEIIPSRDVIEVENAPGWLLGKMNWRGVEVPLVSFEAAAGGADKVSSSTQIAVMYSVSGNDEYPYVGLAISGVPHVSHFSRTQIQVDDQVRGENHPMVAQKIRVNGAAASILDVEAMEQMIVEARV